MFAVKALPVAALLVAGVALAPAASADQYDFVLELDNNGVVYTDIMAIMEAGKQVCRAGRAIPDPVTAVRTMGSQLAAAGVRSQAELGIAIPAAANSMCPDIWPVIRKAIDTSKQEGGA
jgi:hypothetical protein